MMEFDGQTPKSNLEDNIITAIASLSCGIVVVGVEVKVGADGVIVAFVTVEGGVDKAQLLVATILEQQAKDNCTAGVLCHATDTFILTSNNSSFCSFAHSRCTIATFTVSLAAFLVSLLH